MKLINQIFIILLWVNTLAQTSPSYHTVKPKQTLYSISKEYNVSVQDIKSWNNLSSNEISINQKLIIGYSLGNVNDQAAENQSYHTIQPGETLYSISKKYNVEVGEIKSWNKLQDNTLSVGQKLMVRHASSSGVVSQENPMPKTNKQTDSETDKINRYASNHKVLPKETLYSISKKYNVKVEDLKSWNNLRNSTLSVGQVLIVGSDESQTSPEVNSAPKSNLKPEPGNNSYIEEKITHTVRLKETLYSISKAYQVHVDDLKIWNGLNNNNLSIGQNLIVGFKKPGKNAPEIKEVPAPPPATVNANKEIAKKEISHQVKPKETLYAISKIYNVSVNDLKLWNSLSDNTLSVGQQLIVGTGNYQKLHPEIKPTQPADRFHSDNIGINHTVKPKETLYSISKKYNVTVQNIKQWNNLSSNTLEIGDVLAIGRKQEKIREEAEDPKPLAEAQKQLIAPGNEYEDALATADRLYDEGYYEMSKYMYLEALEISPEKDYPKQKLNKLSKILGVSSYQEHPHEKPVPVKSVESTTIQDNDSRNKIIELPEVVEEIVRPSKEQEAFISVGHEGAIHDLKFSSDGARLLSCGSDERIILWNVEAEMAIRTYGGHSAPINNISWHIDGEMFASSSDDGTVKVWNVHDGSVRKTINIHGQPVKSVDFSRGGDFLAVAGINVEIWNTYNWEVRTIPLATNHGNYNAIKYSPSSNTFAISSPESKSIILFDPVNDLVIKEFRLKANEIAFSKDGSYLVGAGERGKIRGWKPASAKNNQFTITTDNPGEAYYSIAVSPDNKYVAAGSKRNRIKIINLESGKLHHVIKGHESPVTALAFSPNGQLLASAGSDKVIRLWNMATGTLTKTLKGPVVESQYVTKDHSK